MNRQKITIAELHRKKQNKEKITMMTAYDYPTASLVDQAGIDTILVGDSLGMVVLGYDSTVPVTMDEMIHHCKAVGRGAKHSFIIGDMPFMSYHSSVEKAIENAGRFIKEAGCDSVKLEGGSEMAHVVKAIVDVGIPVCAHIGLTPQTATKLSGFKVQGKDAESAKALVQSARDLEQAGAFMIVMECIPDILASKITQELKIPTIGIGAGKGCDGQVLVYHDLVGLFERFTPKFVKQYINLSPQIKEALAQFKKEVEEGTFPGPEHTFSMNPEEAKKI
ncbi:MAG: 3-methyl-2-oxobutanoate hydroxymethyltransferase [Deltaproteobacteria bacterium]|nr:3-methyl-2-oxobutanoate hydroxymethyltransferase [Deltaproteobacteria bacterium]MBW1928813.1 3-methyl-2-oxobutanoate hydroxymethyltransferase [Deltaproteobacteria bacterium]MBW2026112.1 3-methyl-2-oxobutanoate hydroxymethyltransferase [Deltaproteobacteria bacterium]MBW2125853.1 3-methyl-2-oxobutanoate hydroxymethyltransferase [Deltaproteobacteria bacterium]RLB23297.1 MAG: 3-methyl-2-oxobutanoate hydroxymethyltransferase [Deltaproteobacteria bacterium]